MSEELPQEARTSLQTQKMEEFDQVVADYGVSLPLGPGRVMSAEEMEEDWGIVEEFLKEQEMTPESVREKLPDPEETAARNLLEEARRPREDVESGEGGGGDGWEFEDGELDCYLLAEDRGGDCGVLEGEMLDKLYKLVLKEQVGGLLEAPEDTGGKEECGGLQKGSEEMGFLTGTAITSGADESAGVKDGEVVDVGENVENEECKRVVKLKESAALFSRFNCSVLIEPLPDFIGTSSFFNRRLKHEIGIHRTSKAGMGLKVGSSKENKSMKENTPRTVADYAEENDKKKIPNPNEFNVLTRARAMKRIADNGLQISTGRMATKQKKCR